MHLKLQSDAALNDKSDNLTSDIDSESSEEQAQIVPMAKNADYPVFTGTRPGAWIKAMEIAFAANGVNDHPVKINTAAAHLGDYINWFLNQPAFTHWKDGTGNECQKF